MKFNPLCWALYICYIGVRLLCAALILGGAMEPLLTEPCVTAHFGLIRAMLFERHRQVAARASCARRRAQRRGDDARAYRASVVRL